MEDKFSRQSYAIGKNSINKIKECSVLVLNFNHLSLEIIKNLILLGFEKIDIDIDDTFQNNSSNLYYTNNKLFDYLKSLNPTTSINNINNKFFEITDYNVVILSNMFSKKINKVCRENNICFIMSWCLGLSGCIFNDFSNNFTSRDLDGENYNYLIIENIENNIITCKDKHLLQNDDILLLNDHEIVKVIKIINMYKFLINFETNNITTLKKMKKTKEFHFKSLKKSLNINQELIPNFKYFNREKLLHILYLSFFDYLNKYNTYPSIENINSFKEIIILYSNIDDEFQIIIHKFLSTINGNFLPISSIIGSIVSQEVIKYILNKFIPINSWFNLDCFELLKDNEIITKNKNDNNKYNDLINIFGNETLDKIQNTKPFVVGTGAIGCELLKQLMSLGTKNIITTDMDNIEVSNLSRQFLFNNDDIHKSKSIVASQKVMQMNNDIKCFPLTEKLCPETENIFNQQFYDDIDINLLALDNMEARLYVNSQTIKYKKPLFDSGTTGLQGSVQVILPNITETYEANKNNQQENIPLCTIKSFPYKVEHNIQWAKEIFEEEFYNNINLLIKYKNNLNLLNEIDTIDMKELINVINKYSYFNKDFNYHYILSYLYYKNYVFNIKELNKQYKNKKEELKGKNLPNKINIKYNTNYFKEYFLFGYNLLNEIFNTNEIPKDYNLIDIKKTQKRVINKKLIIKILNSFSNINSIIFEKDDKSHIQFITNIVNLRNIQYNMKITDEYEVKLISGKIIPALITTTSLIAGFQIIEYIKYIKFKDDIKLELFNIKYVNLGINYIDSIDPVECKTTKIGKFNYNEWNNKLCIDTNNTQKAIKLLEYLLETKIEYMIYLNDNNHPIEIYDGDDIILPEINFNNKVEILFLEDLTLEIQLL